MAQNQLYNRRMKLECEIIKVSNEISDVNLQDPLYKMPPAGVFTKQLEQYLQFISIKLWTEQKGDVAVNSLKDLPIIIDTQLYLAAYTKFEQRGDVVLLNNKYNYKNLGELPNRFKIGTSSLRRISIIKNRYPKLNLINIRGNLNTRILKLDQGQYDEQFQQKLVFQDQVWLIERKSSFIHQHKQPQEFNAERMIRIQQKDYKFEMIQIHKRDVQLNEQGGCRLLIAVYSECREDGQVYINGRVLAVYGTKTIKDEAIDHFEKVGQILFDNIKVLGGIELIESLKQQK
ncbi:unnamed protein product [Paramecium primaurelia]|uniref:hydroxymethylbilane synthase n=1 Tax=Paramecium primaurelia TaxID=5886 RepID=A0A8S1MAN7_PARPR|nr:unnamed protein product [Paramecium primaurelia]